MMRAADAMCRIDGEASDTSRCARGRIAEAARRLRLPAAMALHQLPDAAGIVHTKNGRESSRGKATALCAEPKRTPIADQRFMLGPDS